MAEKFNLTFHYLQIGINPVNYLTGEVTTNNLLIHTDFEGDPNFDSEEIEGQTGADTLILEEERKSAETECSWEFKQFLESGMIDYWYCLFGNIATDTAPTPQIDADDVCDWHFEKNMALAQPIPYFTLHNGYQRTTDDARTYANNIISEFELTFDEDGAQGSITTASAAPRINQPNTARVMAIDPTRIAYGKTRYFIADAGKEIYDENVRDEIFAGDFSSIEEFEAECFTSTTLTYSNEIISDPCIGVGDHENAPIPGKTEWGGESEIIWNHESKKIFSAWYSGKDDGELPDYIPLFKEMLVVSEGKTLKDDQGEPIDKKSYQIVYIPYTQINVVTEPRSGEDTKTLTLEHKSSATTFTSPWIVDVRCKQPAISFGTPV